MKTNQAYPEEFKIEAIKQITELSHKVAEVLARLGFSQHSPCKWVKNYGMPKPEGQDQAPQAEELRWLKAELKRLSSAPIARSAQAIGLIGQLRWSNAP